MLLALKGCQWGGRKESAGSADNVGFRSFLNRAQGVSGSVFASDWMVVAETGDGAVLGYDM